MGLPLYLAMTPAEMASCQTLPDAVAWMACHFSPYGTGLVNLPETVPSGSLLILDDRIPVWDHDPDLIARQLRDCLEDTGAAGVLLDFETGDPRLGAVAQAVLEAVPGAVTAGVLDRGPVFLPPIPPDTLPGDWLAPWQDREIWLELALDGITVTVDRQGSTGAPCGPPYPADPFRNEKLLCSYRAAVLEDRAEFTLFRTRQDLRDLLECLHIARAVGLYQELGPPPL